MTVKSLGCGGSGFSVRIPEALSVGARTLPERYEKIAMIRLKFRAKGILSPYLNIRGDLVSMRGSGFRVR